MWGHGGIGKSVGDRGSSVGTGGDREDFRDSGE